MARKLSPAAILSATLLLAAAFVTTTFLAQASPPNTQSAAKSQPSWVFRLLNASPAAVEKELGKPNWLDEDKTEAEYSRKGFKVIGLGYYDEQGRSEVVELEFEKDPGSWQEALKFCGISPEGVKARAGSPKMDPSYKHFDLTGIKGIPSKWEVTYFPAKTGADADGVVPESYSKLSFYGPDAS